MSFLEPAALRTTKFHSHQNSLAHLSVGSKVSDNPLAQSVPFSKYDTARLKPSPQSPPCITTTVTTITTTTTTLAKGRSTPVDLFSKNPLPTPHHRQDSVSSASPVAHHPPRSVQQSITSPPPSSPSSSTNQQPSRTFQWPPRMPWSPTSMSTPPSRDLIVTALHVIGVLNMFGIMAIEPTPLLFMNEIGFTNRWNLRPYVTTRVLSLTMPVLANIFLTRLSESAGTAVSLSLGALISGGGLIMILFARQSLWLFWLSFMMYSTSYTLRVVRISLICRIIPQRERTPVLAIHALMAPLGAVFGPLLWILAELYRGRFYLLYHSVIVDRFTLAYLSSSLVFFCIIGVSLLYLTNIAPLVLAGPEGRQTQQLENSQQQGQQQPNDTEFRTALLQYSNGEHHCVSLKHYRCRTMIFFSVLLLCVQMSAEFFMTAFEPAMVNVFHASDAQMGELIDLTAILAIIPPLLVSWLSRYLKDRSLLKIGLGIKFVGMALYLPLFGSVQQWQVVVGYLLIVKASIFFTTSTMSLFSKVLGPMSTSSMLGILASAQSLGPAIAQLLVADKIIMLFGLMRFAILTLPVILALLVILWTENWLWLDPDAECTRLVRQAAEDHEKENS